MVFRKLTKNGHVEKAYVLNSQVLYQNTLKAYIYLFIDFCMHARERKRKSERERENVRNLPCTCYSLNAYSSLD